MTENEKAILRFRYKRFGVWEVTNFRIYSPILVRIDGGPKDIGFNDLAPSLGYGFYKIEFKGSRPSYLGINLLGTIMQTHVDTINFQNNRYALGLGSYLDIGGIISVGTVYQFKDEKLFFTLGFRIEELRKLFDKK
jgi:hypothetical protein